MKYKVGDKAIIIRRTHGHGLEIGETVKITEICAKSYHVRSFNDRISWGVTDEEISPLIPKHGTNKTYAPMVLEETD